jgi:hypothetical protein
MVERVEVHS